MSTYTGTHCKPRRSSVKASVVHAYIMVVILACGIAAAGFLYGFYSH